jgi:thioredoxin 2
MPDSLHISCPACLATNRIPASRLQQNPVCGRCHQSLFTATPLELDEAAFGRVQANTDVPILIDFWASWCGPCKMMAPVFERAAAELEPECRLVKINTEQCQKLRARPAPWTRQAWSAGCASTSDRQGSGVGAPYR